MSVMEQPKRVVGNLYPQCTGKQSTPVAPGSIDFQTGPSTSCVVATSSSVLVYGHTDEVHVPGTSNPVVLEVLGSDPSFTWTRNTPGLILSVREARRVVVVGR